MKILGVWSSGIFSLARFLFCILIPFSIWLEIRTFINFRFYLHKKLRYKLFDIFIFFIIIFFLQNRISTLI